MALNIADLFEHAVDVVPDRKAIQVGSEILTFADLEAQSNQVAHFLQSRGVKHGDHVAIYAKNGTKHVVAMMAVFKLRAVVINVNYRYVEGELDYIFDNSDAVTVIHDQTYAPLMDKCAPKHDKIHTVLVIPDDSGADFSGYQGIAWETAVAGQSAERDFGPRSGEDLYIVYTGGTTGYPKGVMWQHQDVWRTLGGGIDFMTGELLTEFDQSEKAKTSEPMTGLPLSPIMHGGAQWGMLMRLFSGDHTILVPNFDPKEVWEIIDREQVALIFITGDAMGRPLIDEFEKGGYSGSSLIAIASSAAIFSRPVKERWMNALPNAFYTDSVGSSETGFQGTGLQDKSAIKDEGVTISLGRDTVVVDENRKILDMVENIGEIGFLARGRNVPVGYYKDPEKSAATFVEIDGVRYSIPGDFVRIEPDNRITLLGRGSNCINTGGEKVYPEEVESAMKSHPQIFDVLVVGVPDERFGNAVTAVIQPVPEAEIDFEEVRTYLRDHLSGYKIPKHLTVVSEIPRHATGKANYPEAKRIATSALDPA